MVSNLAVDPLTSNYYLYASPGGRATGVHNKQRYNKMSKLNGTSPDDDAVAFPMSGTD